MGERQRRKMGRKCDEMKERTRGWRQIVMREKEGDMKEDSRL